MISKKFSIPFLSLCFAAALTAQQTPVPAPAVEAQASSKAARVGYYIDATTLDASILLPTPPAADSGNNGADLWLVHEAENTRTPAQAAAAKADEANESIFAFSNVFGPGFNAQALPITAALGAHLKNDQGVIGSQVKATFKRPRPYQIDLSLHPVCEVGTKQDSYPSGHGITGYLSALALIQIAPERKDEILARADEYAHNRVVCGVHYQSDVEASRKVAYVVFGYMLSTPRFQRDVAAAREEMIKAGLLME